MDALERDFLRPHVGVVRYVASVRRAEVFGRIRRLVSRLFTRPVEDLLSGPPPAADLANQGNQVSPSAPEAARTPAHDAAKTASRPPEPVQVLPSMFTWMAIFS